MVEVIDRTLGAKTPTYSTILDLDKRIKEQYLPEWLSEVLSSEAGRYPPSLNMKGFLLAVMQSLGEELRCLVYTIL